VAVEPQTYVHGTKLAQKAADDTRLAGALTHYQDWRTRSLAITTRDESSVRELTALLNGYKDTVEPIFDARPNSAQEVLQPSILEEFFEYLFAPTDALLGAGGVRRPAPGFISLVFHPERVSTLVEQPELTIGSRDHDFILGVSLDVSLTVQGTSFTTTERVVVPAIAIECKRYLERNMLDECAGTAERVKSATPYCLYLVAAEFLKMDDASPELSRIDEIYVLRRQRNSERLSQGFVPKPIQADLVWHLYQTVIDHLTAIWWDPVAAVERGTVFAAEARLPIPPPINAPQAL
jgi:hypothetical protein